VHVAALGIEASGEGIEQRDGTGDLAGARLLLDTAPRIVGDRARLPQEPGGALDVLALDPGDRLDRRGGILAAPLVYSPKSTGSAFSRS